MKPLLSAKVTRESRPTEWEPAEHHLTVEGLTAFAQRQEQRRREAQAKAQANVRPIKRRATA